MGRGVGGHGGWISARRTGVSEVVRREWAGAFQRGEDGTHGTHGTDGTDGRNRDNASLSADAGGALFWLHQGVGEGVAQGVDAFVAGHGIGEGAQGTGQAGGGFGELAEFGEGPGMDADGEDDGLGLGQDKEELMFQAEPDGVDGGLGVQSG